MSELLLAMMIAVVAVEYPGGEVPTKHAAEAAELAVAFVDVGRAGRIVSPKVDAALLAANAFYESRWWARGKDGDCSYTRGARPVLVCSSVGPEQVSKGARWFLPRFDASWRGVTVEQLREPRTNVRAGYAILRHWSLLCGSPAKAFAAYRRGSCPHSAPLEARKRCTLAKAIAARLGAKPWKCGHEELAPVRGHGARLARAASAATW